MQRFEDFCVERFDIDPDVPPTREDVLERPPPGAGARPRRHQLGDGGGALRLPPADPGDARRGGPAHRRQQPDPVPGGAEPPGDLDDRRDALRPDLGEPRQPGAREHPGRAGLRHRQHRHRRAAAGPRRWRSSSPTRSCRRSSTPTAAIVVVTAHRRENWGDGLRGIAEGVARPRRPPSRGRLRPPGPPEPARARGADRAPPGSRQRPAHRAARLRDLRPPARPRPHRDHRLRRHPGRGAVARQAGPGHPRDDRAHRGPRRRHPAAGRHRPAR